MTLKTIPYEEVQQNLSIIMKTVTDDSIPIMIEKDNRRVVMISENDYSSLVETVYVLSTPEQVKQLSEALQDIEEGRTVQIPVSKLKSMI